MLPLLLLGLTLMMRFFPDAPPARFLHTYLVAKPVRWSLDLDRRRLVYYLIVIGLCLTASEMVAILGTDFLLAYSWHLTLYLDGMAAAAALAVLARLKATARYLRARAVSVGVRSVRRFRTTARSHASARPVERGKADNDDDLGWAYAKVA
jgi:hypothetical protein